MITKPAFKMHDKRNQIKQIDLKKLDDAGRYLYALFTEHNAHIFCSKVEVYMVF